MRKYKSQIKICNARRYFSEESLVLLFPHSAQPYMLAKSSITMKKEIGHLAERRTHDH